MSKFAATFLNHALRPLLLSGLAVLIGLMPLASRAEEFKEGKEYIRLATPQQSESPGKIEVIEFFWYNCPHCYEFEPTLEAWLKKLPKDVSFKRLPVAFGGQAVLQQLYYTIEELGKLPALHLEAFKTIHEFKRRLETPEAISAFFANQGVDAKKAQSLLNSFSVASKSKRAELLTKLYEIESVPSMSVAGRYVTSPSYAKDFPRMLAVVDDLIARERRAMKAGK